ncbi:Uncharacterised protein [Bordetella pertussis]|nr:Uncharacterised protein [Bordetella pertussis]CFM38611.1 Uncharacterised protein [Bordetella pertussis]CFN57905.1 Uncharacterised protein [Bordetella pertussis]CFO08151.1 Uncharacterised protein [Bordetella pertussis]CFO25468.1 Uncharacterised protein [Bordetella pertussis]
MILNTETASARRCACSCSEPAAAAASSTSAAFCCVTSSICDTARLTCSIPLDCSSEAAEISPMMSVTRLTEATISCIVAPTRSTCCEPVPTLPTESSISTLISLAAWALRCASERTSPATTAKPLPCSPARAASTAAFSARILVWNAIPSITDTISEILRELAEMSCIVVTTSDTAEPPRSATSEATPASWLAWRALSAFCLTVEASCSIEAAVSSSEAACSSVRLDRSVLPAEISREPTLISSTPRRTAATVRVRLSSMRLRPANSWPISLLLRTSTRAVRSPAAILSKCWPASLSGRSTARPMNTPQPAHSASARTINTRVTVLARRCSARASSTSASVSVSIRSRYADAAVSKAVFRRCADGLSCTNSPNLWFCMASIWRAATSR